MMIDKQVKVELAVGESSLAFTGTEDLFREAFPDLLEKVLSSPVGGGTSKPPLKVTAEDVSDSRADLDIVGVCQALNVENGPTLVMAACVKLSVIDGKRSFTHKEILHEVGEAHGYVTDSHKTNLKRNIQSIVKRHELIQEKKDTYALSPDQRSEYGRKLEQR